MSDLVFRRIHGHVVAIKPKKAAEGAAIAGAGLGVAAATGNYAAKLTLSGALAEDEARSALKALRKSRALAEKTGPLFKQAAGRKYLKTGQDILRTMVVSRKNLNAAINIGKAGSATGSALVAAGVHHALSGTNLDKDKKTKAAIAGAAGVATHFVIKSVFLKKVGTPRTFDAIRKAAKALILKKFGG